MSKQRATPNNSPIQQLVNTVLRKCPFNQPVTKVKTKKPTVVVIDDEESIRDIYQVLLEREGYRVLTASDGQAGLEILKSEEHSPSLVLVDCSMPHINGETFLLKMKVDLPQIFLESKVVGFTCFPSSSIFFKRIEALAFDCREKPCDISGILRLVADYLGLPPNPYSAYSSRFADEH